MVPSPQISASARCFPETCFCRASLCPDHGELGESWRRHSFSQAFSPSDITSQELRAALPPISPVSASVPILPHHILFSVFYYFKWIPFFVCFLVLLPTRNLLRSFLRFFYIYILTMFRQSLAHGRHKYRYINKWEASYTRIPCPTPFLTIPDHQRDHLDSFS